MYGSKYIEMGQKIRYYRLSLELGQGVLAEQIGITPQYLSKIEHGSARPSMDLVFRIADKLQVQAAQLLEVS
jgi:transcriptional regulator with XRE-family HTH domain